MALFGFSIVGIRQNHPRRGEVLVNHAGAMIEATSLDEASGMAARVANRLFPGATWDFRQARAWPADTITTAETASLAEDN